MQVKLFTRKTCARCPPAKKICEGLRQKGVAVVFIDVDTPDGRDEATRHGVKALPTTILLGDEGTELFSWRGDAPDESLLNTLLSGK